MTSEKAPSASPGKSRTSRAERAAYRASEDVGGALGASLEKMVHACSACGKCQERCGFLAEHGSPGEIAFRYRPAEPGSRRLAFECSLCGLCVALCPTKKGIDPSELFLEMRREEVRLRGGEALPEHARLVAYEGWGRSGWLAWEGIPEGADTVFFPGCALPGTRPEVVERLYELLADHVPRLGVVLDCCLLPSHDLGREEHFEAHFPELRTRLVPRGIRRVLVACPSCRSVLLEYGGELEVETVYETLARLDLGIHADLGDRITIHDPCRTRQAPGIRAAVRDLVRRLGIEVEELERSGETTTCCGEGGAIRFVRPDLSEGWAEAVRQDANGRRLVTYCSGCVQQLRDRTSALHVLDLLLDTEAAMAGGVEVARSPWTHWNRFWLKRRLARRLTARQDADRS